jgi:hypothetical protein
MYEHIATTRHTCRRSRLKHRCFGCGCLIVRGEAYVRHFCFGGLQSYDVHEDCDALLDELDVCEEYGEYDLAQFYGDYLADAWSHDRELARRLYRAVRVREMREGRRTR